MTSEPEPEEPAETGEPQAGEDGEDGEKWRSAFEDAPGGGAQDEEKRG